MVNKKGVIRIIEAVIAILIVVGAVVLLLHSKKVQTEQEFCSLLPGLVDEVAKNEQIRSMVLSASGDKSNEISSITSFLNDKLRNPGFVFRAKICDLNEACTLDEGGLNKIDICVEQRLISTTKNQNSFSPRILKVFMFRI